MVEGCNHLADAVQVTLGPSGRNVVSDKQFGTPKSPKEIEFVDRHLNVRAQLVKQVSSRTVEIAGDAIGSSGIGANMNRDWEREAAEL